MHPAPSPPDSLAQCLIPSNGAIGGGHLQKKKKKKEQRVCKICWKTYYPGFHFSVTMPPNLLKLQPSHRAEFNAFVPKKDYCTKSLEIPAIQPEESLSSQCLALRCQSPTKSFLWALYGRGPSPCDGTSSKHPPSCNHHDDHP